MEYEGQRIDTSDHQTKKLKVMLASRDAEIKTLKSLLEETTRVKDEKIEALTKKVKFYSGKRGEIKIRPKAKKNKPTVETTDDESQGVCESMAEVPESPPIST